MVVVDDAAQEIAVVQSSKPNRLESNLNARAHAAKPKGRTRFIEDAWDLLSQTKLRLKNTHSYYYYLISIHKIVPASPARLGSVRVRRARGWPLLSSSLPLWRLRCRRAIITAAAEWLDAGEEGRLRAVAGHKQLQAQ